MHGIFLKLPYVYGIVNKSKVLSTVLVRPLMTLTALPENRAHSMRLSVRVQTKTVTDVSFFQASKEIEIPTSMG